MACKRLRGWQLEMESGRPSKATTLEKDTLEKESALGTKLLRLWAHGTLSAVMVRELAHLAIQDGAKGEDLHCMAKAGDWGGRPGNCHRDIMARFCHHFLCPSQSTSRLDALTPKHHSQPWKRLLFSCHTKCGQAWVTTTPSTWKRWGNAPLKPFGQG